MSSKQHAIAQLAYLLWESRGRPENTAERDWAEAEALVASQEPPPASEPADGDPLATGAAAARKAATRRKTDRKPKVIARAEPKSREKPVRKATSKKDAAGDASDGARSPSE